MYRLLEKIPASPQKQQTLGKSSRQRSGRPAGRACGRRGGYNHRP